MNGQYEVLNPWAEVDPIPLQGLSPRLADLSDKRIGLFINSKIAAPTIQATIEQKLSERFSNLTFSRFCRMPNCEVAETKDKDKYEQWINEVDAIIFAVGD